jgi:hypothetical protein
MTRALLAGLVIVVAGIVAAFSVYTFGWRGGDALQASREDKVRVASLVSEEIRARETDAIDYNDSYLLGRVYRVEEYLPGRFLVALRDWDENELCYLVDPNEPEPRLRYRGANANVVACNEKERK